MYNGNKLNASLLTRANVSQLLGPIFLPTLTGVRFEISDLIMVLNLDDHFACKIFVLLLNFILKFLLAIAWNERLI